MNIKKKKIEKNKFDESLETNFSETQSPNNSYILYEKKTKRKSVSFNTKIDIIQIKCYKKENKKNSISKKIIRENLLNYKKMEDIYRPVDQNCFGCLLF